MKKLSSSAIDQVAGGCFSFFSTPAPVSNDIVMHVTSGHLYGGAVALLGFVLGTFAGALVQKNIDYIHLLEHELNRK
ncbi:hypothetical protein CC99x_000450 [Candidatus Berkiella cookevillensis]|uniref:Uncharacterized protein n=1 Tax=Candidatus Berkiella cookevillensis TaxID=437022 RepID=A0A0Q9Y941_9GAMM|nr:hypothetical protein [Candidatus Berkiella cookevillensis]MCS5707363.1 hypothetical protein [Candidatus Berkiella cookevillensis]